MALTVSRGQRPLASKGTSDLVRERSHRILSITSAILPLAAAMVLWSLSLSHIDVHTLGKGGLPPALPASWYAALTLLTASAALTIWSRRSNPWLTAAYIAAMVVILYATVPAISSVPQYAYVYKHIGVTRFISLHGGVDPSIDIYNRWPGFFALAASFSRWTHVDALSLAAWAEPFFSLVQAMLVAALGFAFGGDRRVAAFSAMIFTLGNWVGEAYFAPQAAALTLELAILLSFVRIFASAPMRPWLTGVMAWLVGRPQPPQRLAQPLQWTSRAGGAVVLGLDIVMVATHQLTPYVLLLQLGALWFLGVTRARLLILATAAMTIGYLVPNVGFLTHQFGLFSSFDPVNNISINAISVAHLNFLEANAAKLLSGSLVLMMLVAAGRLSRLGSGRRAVVLIALSFAPFAAALAQGYGGNGAIRVLVFSVPVWSVLIALGCATLPTDRWRQCAAATACLVLATFFIPAFYGGEELTLIPPSEVTASAHFYAYAPAGSVLIPAAPIFPGRVGPRYSVMVGPTIDDQLDGTLLGIPSFQHRQLGNADVPAVVSAIHRYSARGFVVFATSGERLATLTGLAPPGALPSLEVAIERSPSFRLWFVTRDARIYELVGPQHLAPFTRTAPSVKSP